MDIDLEQEERQEKIGGSTNRAALEDESRKLLTEAENNKRKAQYGAGSKSNALPPKPHPKASGEFDTGTDAGGKGTIRNFKEEKEREDDQLSTEEVGIMASRYPYLNIYRAMRIERQAGSPWFVLHNNGKVVAALPAPKQASKRVADVEATRILQDVARIGLVATLKQRGGRVAQASDTGVVGGGVRDFIPLSDPAADQSVGARPGFDTKTKRTPNSASPTGGGEQTDNRMPHTVKTLGDAVQSGRTTDFDLGSVPSADGVNVLDRQMSDMRQPRAPKTVADPVLSGRTTDMRSASRRNPWVMRAQLDQRNLQDPGVQTAPLPGDDVRKPGNDPGFPVQPGEPGQIPLPPNRPPEIPGPVPPGQVPPGNTMPRQYSRNPWVMRAQSTLPPNVQNEQEIGQSTAKEVGKGLQGIKTATGFYMEPGNPSAGQQRGVETTPGYFMPSTPAPKGAGKVAVAPPGWEGTAKQTKKHDEIDNPWALAWSMKNKGDVPGGKEGQYRPSPKFQPGDRVKQDGHGGKVTGIDPETANTTVEWDAGGSNVSEQNKLERDASKDDRVMVAAKDFDMIVADLEKRIANKSNQQTENWKRAYTERFARALLLAAERKRLNQEQCELKTAFGDVLDQPGNWNVPINLVDADTIYTIIEAAFSAGGNQYAQSLVRQAMKFMGMSQEAFLEIEADTRKLRPVDARSRSAQFGESKEDEKEEAMEELEEADEEMEEAEEELEEAAEEKEEAKEELEEADEEEAEKKARRRMASRGNMILAPTPDTSRAARGTGRHASLRDALKTPPF